MIYEEKVCIKVAVRGMRVDGRDFLWGVLSGFWEVFCFGVLQEREGVHNLICM